MLINIKFVIMSIIMFINIKSQSRHNMGIIIITYFGFRHGRNADTV